MRAEAGLVARDAAGLVAFYRDVLGFEVVDELRFPQGTVTRMRRDDARMKLYAPVDGAAPAAAERWHDVSGFRYLALLVDARDDVDALAAAAGSGGGAVVTDPVDHRPGARMALVTDPEGNVVEVLFES